MSTHRPPLLSRKTHSQIRAYLTRVWKRPRTCPICQTENWHIQSGAVVQAGAELELGDESSFEPSPVTIPTVQVICRNCNFYHNFLLVPILEAAKGVKRG